MARLLQPHPEGINIVYIGADKLVNRFVRRTEWMLANPQGYNANHVFVPDLTSGHPGSAHEFLTQMGVPELCENDFLYRQHWQSDIL